MESAVPGSSSYEQGSSWAVEVGGHLKVHSILVESISKNGQMLVEVNELKYNFDYLFYNIDWLEILLLRSKEKTSPDEKSRSSRWCSILIIGC